MAQKRLIVSVVVMLFLWGSIAPAAYSPCHCEKILKAFKTQSKASCCSQKIITTSCCAKDTKAPKSCCSTKSKPNRFPIQKKLSCACPLCPYSKQMQAATDSGQTHNQSGKRVHAVVDISNLTAYYFRCASEIISNGNESHIFGITILSRTCSLLI